MKNVKENSETLEWRFENKFYNRDTSSSPQYSPNNEGTCKAVHMFMTLMAIVQYHNQP